MASRKSVKADLSVVEAHQGESSIEVIEPRPVGRPKKYQTAAEMEVKIDEYFDWCDQQLEVTHDAKGNEKILHKPYTVSGLCLYLDMDRVTLLEYQDLDEYSSTIKKAKVRIENNLEENIMNGKSNPIFGIFSMKNNFGWKDKTEVDINQKSLVITANVDEDILSLQKKYNF